MAIGFKMGGITPFVSVPNGKTVLPVNDIDLLLRCAGIKGSTITTLAELFADTTTLQTVINSNNAIDYLVRSTEFAKSEALVPTMTSDTEPSGQVLYSSEYNTSSKGYYAFDGTTNSWQGSTTTNQWVGYHFTNPVKLYKFTLSPRIGGAGPSRQIKNYKIEGSNDGTNYTELFSGIIESGSSSIEVSGVLTNTETYSYARVYVIDSYANVQIGVSELQFYSELGVTENENAMQFIGANDYASNTLLGNNTWREAICNSQYFESVLNTKVPVMTSDTTPSGECSASGYTQQNMAYKAFDGSSSSGWVSNTKGNSWIQYQFTSVVKFCMVKKKDIYNRFNTFKMQTSTDGNTWVDVTDTLTNSLDVTVIVSTITSGQYVRLQVLSNTTNYNDGIYGTTQGLQFYCRQDV